MGRVLRVALAQLRSGIDPAANRAHALPLLREAAASGARLIATPECTTRLDRNRDRLLPALLEEEIDPDVKAWRAIAAELGVWLLLGSTTVKAQDGRGYNRSLLFSPDGKIAARYDKIHLFDVQLGSKSETYRESATFAPGEKAVLAEGPMGARLGLTICYDVRFPALYRALALAGAAIIAVPAAFTRPTGEAHWEALLRARAIETNAFVIAPAQGGVHEDGRGTWGRSMIVDPWGKVIAALDHDEPGLVAADLDLDLVDVARAKIPAWRGGPAFEGP
ncbi:MAG: carbon-nitrogen hydrolase family protein [Alphaproteobacteria bacterium]|nr:carbon-nitrogen hydrolase family protein [Alphaproteobacteria bacterium]